VFCYFTSLSVSYELFVINFEMYILSEYMTVIYILTMHDFVNSLKMATCISRNMLEHLINVISRAISCNTSDLLEQYFCLAPFVSPPSLSQQPPVGQGHLFIEASPSHSVGLLWTSDQPDSRTST
jgi:hypothetical protein